MKNLFYWIIGFFVLLGLYILINNTGDTPKDVKTATLISFEKINSTSEDEDTGVITVVFEGGATSTIVRDALLGKAQEISIVDINYDGKDDVQVVETAGAYNLSTTFFVFDTQQKKFVEYDGFKKALDTDNEYETLGMVNFNKEEKKLSSFFKGRGLGDLYSISEFSFLNGEWYESRTELQDALNYESPDSSQWYYYRTVVTYKPHHATTSIQTTYYVQKDEGDIGELIEVPKSELQKKKIIK